MTAAVMTAVKGLPTLCANLVRTVMTVALEVTGPPVDVSWPPATSPLVFTSTRSNSPGLSASPPHPRLPIVPLSFLPASKPPLRLQLACLLLPPYFRPRFQATSAFSRIRGPSLQPAGPEAAVSLRVLWPEPSPRPSLVLGLLSWVVR